MRFKNLVIGLLKTKNKNEALKDNIIFMNFKTAEKTGKSSCKIIDMESKFFS